MLLPPLLPLWWLCLVPGAVVLLPLLDPDTVVLIENHRPTVGETLLELPAGTREVDEAPEVTAARELAEETGYQAGKLTLIHEFFSAPGIGDELMHLYLAEDLTEGSHHREATEQIENRIASRREIALPYSVTHSQSLFRR